MLNLNWLRTFLAVVSEESFTKAAVALHMTQPGVSKHIAQLEELYGVALIDRSSARFGLTDAGRRLAEQGAALIEAELRLRSEIGHDDPHRGQCRFASGGSFGMKMYSFLLDLSSRYRGLVIHYLYRPNTTIIEHVLDDEIDVGFVTERPASSDLLAREIDSERLALIVPAGCPDVSFDALLRLGFVNHPDGYHHARRLLEENYPDAFTHMEQFPVTAFNNQITRIPEPVALGLGFTVLPEFAARQFANQQAIRIVPLERSVVDPIFWVQKKARHLPARFDFIAAEFAKTLG